jgi:hypothetical protein
MASRQKGPAAKKPRKAAARTPAAKKAKPPSTGKGGQSKPAGKRLATTPTPPEEYPAAVHETVAARSRQIAAIASSTSPSGVVATGTVGSLSYPLGTASGVAAEAQAGSLGDQAGRESPPMEVVISAPVRVANQLDVTTPTTISGGASLEVHQDGIPPPEQVGPPAFDANSHYDGNSHYDANSHYDVDQASVPTQTVTVDSIPPLPGLGSLTARATVRRRPTKKAVLRRRAAAEAALEKLEPTHGGIGHNRRPGSALRGAPLTPTQYRRAMAALHALRVTFEAAIPKRATIQAAMVTLAKTAASLGRWLRPGLDKGRDAFFKRLGTLGATAVVAHVTGADRALFDLIGTLAKWSGQG